MENKKRPRDPNQLGKMIVDNSVGEIEDRQPDHRGRAGGRWPRQGEDIEQVWARSHC
jgi:hypothetical protein